ncbi:MAG TPA: NAD(P)-dependent oxidoreductase [Acidobacteriaceae bacterium]|nr:NAD(P)-dependent oxidoreductase [Acidobacteriaceae bacterium]
MKIVLYGTTGRAGSRILTELLDRGHEVVAIVRNPDKLAPNDGLTVQQGDLSSVEAIAEAIGGAQAVVSAYGPPADKTEQLLGVTKREIAAVQQVSQQASSPEHAPRLIVVGGAGSLEVAPGVTLESAKDFPAAWKPIAQAHEKALELLRASSIDWTYLSPSAFFEPGQRTGKFRLGQDQLLTAPDGKSAISMEDYAIALVDELEQPQHRRQRFTVGY